MDVSERSRPTPARERRSASRPDEAPKMTSRKVCVFYGEKQALFDVTLDIPSQPGHRADRPVGLRQVDLPALPEPHERHDRRLPRHRRHRAGRRGRLRPASSTWCMLRARIGMVFQKPNPFPKSIYENVAYGPRIHGMAAGKAETGRDRRGQPEARRPVERGQGPPAAARHRPFRRPAAAPVHRPRHRGRARSDPDGRAVLGARPDRHGARSRS